MKHIDFSSLIKTLKGFTIKNSPQICAGVGIAMSVVAMTLTIPATVKASKKVQRIKKEKKVEKLNAGEIFKTTWTYYIPVVITEVVSVGFFISSARINGNRNAALAAAYSLTSTAFKEYKDKVTETIGDKKEETIRDSVVQDKIEQSPPSKNGVIITSSGETLFYDTISDRYFTSTPDNVKKAINNLNRDMLTENNMSLNELYYELGLNSILNGEELGWSIEDGYIDVRFSGHITENEKPCLALNFSSPPKYGYRNLY